MPVTTPTTTTRFGIIRWPLATDSFTRAQMNTSHDQIEDRGAVLRYGASLPTGAEYARAFFFRTGDNSLHYSQDGSTWTQLTGFGTPSTQAIGDAASAGTATTLARSDHKHAMPSFGSTTAAVGTTASGGSATTLARSDHVHEVGSQVVGTANLKTDVAGTGLSHTPGSGITTASTYRLARTKATAPTEGTIAAGDVWTDTGVAGKEGLYVRSTSTWQRPWNLPWGMLARTYLDVGTQSGITGEVIPAVNGTQLQATFTAVAGRAYRVTGYVSSVKATSGAVSGTTSCTVVARIKQDPLGTPVNWAQASVNISDLLNTVGTVQVQTVVEGLTAGSKTFAITIAPNASWFGAIQVDQVLLVDRSFILIEDIGPSLA